MGKSKDTPRHISDRVIDSALAKVDETLKKVKTQERKLSVLKEEIETRKSSKKSVPFDDYDVEIRQHKARKLEGKIARLRRESDEAKQKYDSYLNHNTALDNAA